VSRRLSFAGAYSWREDGSSDMNAAAQGANAMLLELISQDA
jgi:hypothetical protein